jgi:opacity protein-like surface antigen
MPTMASAQVTVGVGGQLLSLGGDDFQGIGSGFGGEARVLFPVGTSVLLGAGVQYSSHTIEGIDPNMSVLGLIAEGRYQFKMATGKATPYVGGRGGYVRASISEGGSSASQNGFAFGALAGVAIAMAPTTSLDLGLAFHAVKMGDAKIDGETEPDTDSSGTGFQFRAGVSFKLGGK